MDTGSPLQPLIKNPELVNQEKATQNPAVHLHLSGTIKSVGASLPRSCQASNKEWACSLFFRGCIVLDHPGKNLASLLLGFQKFKQVPLLMRSPKEFLGLRYRPSMGCDNALRNNVNAPFASVSSPIIGVIAASLYSSGVGIQ